MALSFQAHTVRVPFSANLIDILLSSIFLNNAKKRIFLSGEERMCASGAASSRRGKCRRFVRSRRQDLVVYLTATGDNGALLPSAPVLLSIPERSAVATLELNFSLCSMVISNLGALPSKGLVLKQTLGLVWRTRWKRCEGHAVTLGK